MSTSERDAAIGDFAAALTDLRQAAGNPSFREMARRSGCISHASLHDATKGFRLPSWETTEQFVIACGAGDTAGWRERWQQAQRIVFPSTPATPVEQPAVEPAEPLPVWVPRFDPPPQPVLAPVAPAPVAGPARRGVPWLVALPAAVVLAVGGGAAGWAIGHDSDDHTSVAALSDAPLVPPPSGSPSTPSAPSAPSTPATTPASPTTHPATPSTHAATPSAAATTPIAIPDERTGAKYRRADGTSPYAETGHWGVSTLPGPGGSASRYTHSKGATATWSPDLPAAGKYQVRVWIPGEGPTLRNSAAARYTIKIATPAQKLISQQVSSPRWVVLGTWTFPAGTGSSIILTADGIGYTRADAIEFVPVRG